MMYLYKLRKKIEKDITYAMFIFKGKRREMVPEQVHCSRLGHQCYDYNQQ